MTDASPPTGLAGLAASASGVAARGLPPVHLWNPAHCGEIDIRIRRDGTWLHEGAPIGRARLVRLFSTILRLDPDGYHLVTPAEKLRIVVDDAPFLAVSVEGVGDALRFVTNVGDEVIAGPDHALRVDSDVVTGEPRPYLHLRRGLEARLSRPVFYQLADMAIERNGELGVASRGAWFALGPAAA